MTMGMEILKLLRHKGRNKKGEHFLHQKESTTDQRTHVQR